MGNFFKKAFSFVCLFCLEFFLFFASYQITYEVNAWKKQDYVLDNGEWINVGQNVYCESGVDKDASMKKINAVYDKLPQSSKDFLIGNWTIFVSDKMPLSSSHVNQDKIIGATYHNHRVIWMRTDFAMEDFAHECGHAIDRALGRVSEKDEFASIYRSSWSSYVSYGEKGINAHSVSSKSEFFATLFSEYICHKDHLKNNLPEAYTYMNKTVPSSWSYSLPGQMLLFAQQISGYLLNITNETIPASSFSNNYNTVITSVQNNKYIDLNNYSNVVVDTSCLSEDAKIIVAHILHIANNPDLYGECDLFIKIESHISIEEYTEATGFLAVYFGIEEEDVFDIDADASKSKPSTLTIALDKIKRLEAHRVKYLEKAESVLSTLKEGSETEKLMQIANYILSNSEYKDVQNTSLGDFWDNGKGDCATYAMVFKQFANRLGIQCDLIVSPGDKGINHTYNRVVLKDGSVRYYDLTRPNQFVNVGKMDMVDYDVNNFIWTNR